eukprot:m.168227 g.168227  ORF g.168227 m.168227 type:complete len:226 (+) comp12928_c0_seq1:191-868(+)
MRMETQNLADVGQLPTAVEDDVSLRCRFSLMIRCEEPNCRRLNVISAGEDISALQSRHFFCYMNKQGDATKCCHVRQPGEVFVPRRESSRHGGHASTAGPKLAGKRSNGRRERDSWGRVSASSDLSSMSSSRSQSASPRSDDAFSADGGSGGLLHEDEPYDVGSNIMVLHGKTAYPGRISDRNVDARTYLVQYDGLSASRAEWRHHREVISIDEVISNRRTCRDF